MSESIDQNSDNNVEQTKSSDMTNAVFRNGWVLAVFAFVSTGLIAITHYLTKDRIDEAIEASLARRLNELVSPDKYNNDVYHDCTNLLSPELLGSNKPQKVYRMRLDDKPVAIVLSTTAPDGYGGKIELVVGIYTDGTIAGVRSTQHQETPGLGDKIEIEKSQWITQFDGLSLDNLPSDQWKVKKDGGQFDALTGATITPRAVVKAVYNSLRLLNSREKIENLFQQPGQCGVKE